MTTCNKAAAMKPPTRVASSSFAAPAWPRFPGVSALTQSDNPEKRERSGIQTSEAVLPTAVCPSVWTQVRCEIRPAHPKLSFSTFYMCYCMNPDVLSVCLKTWLTGLFGLVAQTQWWFSCKIWRVILNVDLWSFRKPEQSPWITRKKICV